jgi:hypothetical protein
VTKLIVILVLEVLASIAVLFHLHLLHQHLHLRLLVKALTVAHLLLLVKVQIAAHLLLLVKVQIAVHLLPLVKVLIAVHLLLHLSPALKSTVKHVLVVIAETAVIFLLPQQAHLPAHQVRLLPLLHLL